MIPADLRIEFRCIRCGVRTPKDKACQVNGASEIGLPVILAPLCSRCAQRYCQPVIDVETIPPEDVKLAVLEHRLLLAEGTIDKLLSEARCQ